MQWFAVSFPAYAVAKVISSLLVGPAIDRFGAAPLFSFHLLPMVLGIVFLVAGTSSVETIEHIDPHRLSQVERAVFRGYQPRTVVVTTPNREYNVLHGMGEAAMRHPDHRFEWTRAKFRAWSLGVARRNQYAVAFADIGDGDVLLGSSTRMATFTISGGFPQGESPGRRPDDCL